MPLQPEVWYQTQTGITSILTVLNSGQPEEVFKLNDCYLLQRIPLEKYYRQFQDSASRLAFWSTFTPAVQTIYALKIGAPIWSNLNTVRPLEGKSTDSFTTRWKLSLLNPNFALEILNALPPSGALKSVLEESQLLIESFGLSHNLGDATADSKPSGNRKKRRERARKRPQSSNSIVTSLLPMFHTMLAEFDEKEIDRILAIVIAKLQPVSQQQRSLNQNDLQDIFLAVYQDDDNVASSTDDFKECLNTVQELVSTAMAGGDNADVMSKLMGLVNVKSSDMTNLLDTLQEVSGVLPAELQHLYQPILKQTANILPRPK